MISKTIGFRGTQHFQTHPYMFIPFHPISSHISRCLKLHRLFWMARAMIHGLQEGTVSAVRHRESPQSGKSILTLLCRGAKTQGFGLKSLRLGFEVDFSVCWKIFLGLFFKGLSLGSNIFLLEFQGGSHCECPSELGETQLIRWWAGWLPVGTIYFNQQSILW